MTTRLGDRNGMGTIAMWSTNTRKAFPHNTGGTAPMVKEASNIRLSKKRAVFRILGRSCVAFRP